MKPRRVRRRHGGASCIACTSGAEGRAGRRRRRRWYLLWVRLTVHGCGTSGFWTRRRRFRCASQRTLGVACSYDASGPADTGESGPVRDGGGDGHASPYRRLGYAAGQAGGHAHLVARSSEHYQRESARERERAPVDARACVSATRSEPPLVVRERKQGGVVPQGADAGGWGVQ
jgi:hypothetical protein